MTIDETTTELLDTKSDETTVDTTTELLEVVTTVVTTELPLPEAVVVSTVEASRGTTTDEGTTEATVVEVNLGPGTRKRLCSIEKGKRSLVWIRQATAVQFYFSSIPTSLVAF